MICNEIKCHVNTSLGLVGGMHPLHAPSCVRTWSLYFFYLLPESYEAINESISIRKFYHCSSKYNVYELF